MPKNVWPERSSNLDTGFAKPHKQLLKTTCVFRFNFVYCYYNRQFFHTESSSYRTDPCSFLSAIILGEIESFPVQKLRVPQPSGKSSIFELLPQQLCTFTWAWKFGSERNNASSRSVTCPPSSVSIIEFDLAFSFLVWLRPVRKCQEKSRICLLF